MRPVNGARERDGESMYLLGIVYCFHLLSFLYAVQADGFEGIYLTFIKLRPQSSSI